MTAAGNMETRPSGKVSRNRQGQKLGRKGRDTKERILAAAGTLIDQNPNSAVTLSAVAREAGLSMSSVYNYFKDFPALLLALLEPVTLAAREGYLSLLDDYWPDDELSDRCRAFVASYYDFWRTHGRLLHFRNAYADGHELPLMRSRIDVAIPVIRKLASQMGHEDPVPGTPVMSMATSLYVGLERAFSVATDTNFQEVFPNEFALHVDSLLAAQSRLLELGISDFRQSAD